MVNEFIINVFTVVNNDSVFTALISTCFSQGISNDPYNDITLIILFTALLEQW